MIKIKLIKFYHLQNLSLFFANCKFLKLNLIKYNKISYSSWHLIKILRLKLSIRHFMKIIKFLMVTLMEYLKIKDIMHLA
jgi:hypothetical protein